MQTIAQKLSQTGMQIEPWLPQDFDLSRIWTLYGRMQLI
jgi:amidase